MDRQEFALQRILREINKMPFVVLLRKLEFMFYFIFLILALTCFILPMIYNLKMVRMYIAGGFSVVYSICIYFLRFKIYVHFGLMSHVGLFLVFASTIFFETGHDRVGSGMIIIGVLGVLIIFVFATLGKKVIVRNPSDGHLDQPGRNADMDNQALDQGNAIIPNGVIHHIHEILVNGPINVVNQDLGNGHVHQPLNALLDDPVHEIIPNGHAIQFRDKPIQQVPPQIEDENEQVVPQRGDQNEQVIQQREDPNEEVPQREGQIEQAIEECIFHSELGENIEESQYFKETQTSHPRKRCLTSCSYFRESSSKVALEGDTADLFFVIDKRWNTEENNISALKKIQYEKCAVFDYLDNIRPSRPVPMAGQRSEEPRVLAGAGEEFKRYFEDNIFHISEVLANGTMNVVNPDLENRPVHQPLRALEDDPVHEIIPNGHAIQLRDEPIEQLPPQIKDVNEQVVPQREDQNEQVIQQRVDPNEEVPQREDQNEQVIQQREDPNEEVVQQEE